MKNRYPAILVFAFILLFSGYVLADSGKVLFSDQNRQGSSFASDKVQSLRLKVVLPKPLAGYKFDYVRVIVSPSYNPKMEWRKGWMLNEIKNNTLSDIALVPKSALVNGYGTSFMLADIKDYPSAKGFDNVTLNAEVRIYKKLGERKETRWDKMSEKYITETIFQWDEGELIASGNAAFAVPKMSAEEKQGVDKDKAEKLKKLNEIRAKMGKPPLKELP